LRSPESSKKLPEGGIIPEPSTSLDFKTGDWRTERPLWDEGKCVHCLLCWLYCPDSAIKTEDEKMTGIDYDYCKGCGICANVCPPRAGALKMISEEEL
jgi:pyruvate ferredoxin oxidoreductase delta subunit